MERLKSPDLFSKYTCYVDANQFDPQPRKPKTNQKKQHYRVPTRRPLYSYPRARAYEITSFQLLKSQDKAAGTISALSPPVWEQNMSPVSQIHSATTWPTLSGPPDWLSISDFRAGFYHLNVDAVVWGPDLITTARVCVLYTSIASQIRGTTRRS